MVPRRTFDGGVGRHRRINAMIDLVAILGLGFFLGLRHATDPDHVVAITTIVSRERSTRAALAIGALWGLGHSVTILVVGGAIVLFGLVIPPRLGLSMEMAVAVLLIVLGAMNLTGVLENILTRGKSNEQRHDGDHDHPRVALAPSRRLTRLQSVRPLVIGLVHGLSGSAAVALLVLTTMPDGRWAMVYLAVFGVGTVFGMMLLTTLMAAPIARAASWSPAAGRGLIRLTGVLSLSFGLFLAYRVGIQDGLLVGTFHGGLR
jgi:high-affinity nickel-transport protein